MSKRSCKDQQEWWESSYIVPIALGIIIVIMAGYYSLLADEPERGTIGDSFGTLNTLFSALILICAYLAVRYQRKELNDAKTSLAESARAQQETAALHREMLSNQKKFYDASFVLKMTELETAAARGGEKTPKWALDYVEELRSDWDVLNRKQRERAEKELEQEKLFDAINRDKDEAATEAQRNLGNAAAEEKEIAMNKGREEAKRMEKATEKFGNSDDSPDDWI